LLLAVPQGRGAQRTGGKTQKGSGGDDPREPFCSGLSPQRRRPDVNDHPQEQDFCQPAIRKMASTSGKAGFCRLCRRGSHLAGIV